jgi:hypothetical protein
MAVLTAILWVTLALLVLVVGVPFRAAARGSIHEASLAAAAELSWGWGAVCLRIGRREWALSFFGLRAWRFEARGRGRSEEAEDREEEARGRSQGRTRKLRSALEHRSALMDAAARLAAVLRLRVLVRGTVGTGDPADTALLSSAARLLGQLPGVELQLQWDWMEEELEIDLEGRARIWIGHLLLAAIGLLMARENRAALRAVA